MISTVPDLEFAKGKQGVPATRYDEIFEVAAYFMNPPTVSAAMESGKVEEWTLAMEAELQSLWETRFFRRWRGLLARR